MWPLLLAGCLLVPSSEHADNLDPDGDGVVWPEDCASDDPTVSPRAEERCNGQDDDCDGEIDEGCDTGGTGDPDRWPTQPLADASRVPHPADAGAAVVGLPDLSGDGRAELAVGFPGGADGRGVVLIHDAPEGAILSAELARLVLSLADDTAGMGAALAHVGSSTCGAQGGLAVGAPQADEASTSGARIEGGVWVVSLTQTGALALDAPLLQGGQSGARLGTSLTWLRGDDEGLLAAGAPGFGVGGGVLLQAAPCAASPPEAGALVSSESREGAGAALGALDLDGDGIDEVVVGAPEADPNDRADAGRVYVVTHGSGTLDLADSDIVLVGGAARLALGATIATGDLDDDGLADLVLGAPGGGAAYAFTTLDLGTTGSAAELATHTLLIDEPGAGAGVALTDLDDDGALDLAVSACPTCVGAASSTSGVWVWAGPQPAGVTEAPAAGTGRVLAHPGPEVGPALAPWGPAGLLVGGAAPTADGVGAWVVGE